MDTRWRGCYSNTNYILAGLLIESITGNPAAAEVQRRILRPLMLTGTSFPGPDPTIHGPHSGAYFAPFGVRDLSEFNMSWAWMAGEMIGTTADLNSFFRALLGGDLLSPATLDEMLAGCRCSRMRPKTIAMVSVFSRFVPHAVSSSAMTVR